MYKTKVRFIACSRDELEKLYHERLIYFEEKITSPKIRSSLKLGWDNLVGAESTKDLLKRELQRDPISERFKNNSSLENSFLLFGAPGVGKSLIGKVLGNEIAANFLSIRSSDITGPHLGEDEVNLRAMFEVARAFSPTIILIDDCDDLLIKRESCETGGATIIEFLNQWDGGSKDNKGIYIVLTSSVPWCIDMAVVQRVRNVIPLKLPTTLERQNMLQYSFGKQKKFDHALTDQDFQLLAQKTEGYTHFDLCVLPEQVFDLLVINECRKMTFDQVPSGKLRLPLVTLQLVMRCVNPYKCQVPFPENLMNVTAEEANAVFSDFYVPNQIKYELYERLYSTVMVKEKLSPAASTLANNQALLACLLGEENQCFEGTKVEGGSRFKCQILQDFLEQELKESLVFQTNDGGAGPVNEAVTKEQIYKFYRQSCKKMLQIILQCEKCRKKNSDLKNWLTAAELDAFPPKVAADKCLEGILNLHSIQFASSDFLYERKISLLKSSCTKFLFAMSECKSCRKRFAKELPHHTPLPNNSVDSLKKRIGTYFMALF